MPADRQTASAKPISRRDLFRGVGDTFLPKEEARVAVIASHCLALTGVACRSCDDACEVRAIRFRPVIGGSFHPAVDASKCTACGACFDVCPVGALSLVGRNDP